MKFPSEEKNWVEYLIRNSMGFKVVKSCHQHGATRAKTTTSTTTSNVRGTTNTHPTFPSMGTCDVLSKLPVKEKERIVNCSKHPFTARHSTTICKFDGNECKYCSMKDHHFLLCPVNKVSTNIGIVSTEIPIWVPKLETSKSGQRIVGQKPKQGTSAYETKQKISLNDDCSLRLSILLKLVVFLGKSHLIYQPKKSVHNKSLSFLANSIHTNLRRMLRYP